MRQAIKTRISWLLDTVLEPYCSQQGFTRSGRQFTRLTGEVLWIVDVEVGRYSDRAHAEVTLNCGVYVPGFWGAYSELGEPESPELLHCPIFARIGMLDGTGKDKWWHLNSSDILPDTDEMNAADMLRLLEAVAIPFLNRFKSAQDPIQFLSSPRPKDAKYVWPVSEPLISAFLGVLHWLAGDRPTGYSTLEAAIQKTKLASVIEHLRGVVTRLKARDSD